jgi:hypothetical protein
MREAFAPTGRTDFLGASAFALSSLSLVHPPCSMGQSHSPDLTAAFPPSSSLASRPYRLAIAVRPTTLAGDPRAHRGTRHRVAALVPATVRSAARPNVSACGNDTSRATSLKRASERGARSTGAAKSRTMDSSVERREQSIAGWTGLAPATVRSAARHNVPACGNDTSRAPSLKQASERGARSTGAAKSRMVVLSVRDAQAL